MAPPLAPPSDMFPSAGEHVKGTLEDPGKGSVRATGKGKGVSLLPDPGLDLRAKTTNPSTSAALEPHTLRTTAPGRYRGSAYGA